MGSPWPGTDRRTNRLARVDLMNSVCARARVCVGYLSLFCECSKRTIILFFSVGFFFPSSFEMVRCVSVSAFVCVCVLELYTMYMSDKQSELQINVQVRILSFPPLKKTDPSGFMARVLEEKENGGCVISF